MNSIAKYFAVCLMIILQASSIDGATFYSRNATSGGNWNLAASWSSNSDGSGGAAGVPGRNDDVVILNGHTINITATNNNGSTGVSADALGRPNVGTFTQSGTANFYQIGNISINTGGTIASTVRLMFEGYTLIDGTLTSTQDLINLGRLTLSSGGTLTLDDDLVITGTSKTQLDATPNSDDDLYIDHTEATLCGSGSMNIGAASPNTPIISYTNGATIAQICSGFSVTCGPGAGCSGFPTSGTGGFTFDLIDFAYYKYLTIRSDKIPGNLTDFPVLISFSDPDIRTVSDGGHVESANGYDIVFSTSNNCGELSQLDFQLEDYTSNVTTGTIIAWVNVPALSGSTDTEIFMYYGSTAQTSDRSTTAAFDLNYINVYHLHNDFNDGTANGINGTNNGSTDVTGKIADGQNFASASTQYIDLGNPAILNFATTDWTLSAWVRTTTTAQANIISNGGDDGGGVRYVMAANEGSANKLTITTDDNSTKRQANSTTSINDNAWHYVVTVRDGTTLRTYVDGSAEGTNTLPGGYDLSGTSQRNAYIGCGHSQASGNRIKYFNGDIDEARVSNVFRSPNWTLTEYNNQNEPDSFFYVGVEITNICIALPVELLDFAAFPLEKTVELKWTTVSEINNDYFTIERSDNLQTWVEIGKISGAGNSQINKEYSLIDDNPLGGTSYYRLKQTDYDGKEKIEKIVSVSYGSVNKSCVYPNPNSGSFTLVSESTIDQNSIEITDLTGRSVSVSIEKRGTELQISTSNLQPGMYILKFREGNTTKTEEIIIE